MRNPQFQGLEPCEPRLLLSATSFTRGLEVGSLDVDQVQNAAVVAAAQKSATTYAGLRALTAAVGDTATLSAATPRINGTFLAVATADTDDGGIVINSATGGIKWVRQFAHTVAEPIKLDWFMRNDWRPGQVIATRLIQNGDDITGVLTQLKDRYTSGGKLHIMAPTIGNGTFYTGIVDFRQVASNPYIEHFSYLESPVKTALKMRTPTFLTNLQNQAWEQIDESGNPTGATTHRWRTPVSERIWQLFVSRSATEPPQHWSYPVTAFNQLVPFTGTGVQYKAWTCLQVDGQWYLAIYNYDNATYGAPNTWASIEGSTSDLISMWQFSDMTTFNLGGNNLNLDIVGLYRHDMAWTNPATSEVYHAGARGRMDDVNFRKPQHPVKTDQAVNQVGAAAGAMLTFTNSGVKTRNWSIKANVIDTFWDFIGAYVSPGFPTRVNLTIDGTWRNSTHRTGVLFDGTVTNGPNSRIQDPYGRNGWIGNLAGTIDGSLTFTRSGVSMPGEIALGEYGNAMPSPGYIFGLSDQRTGTIVYANQLQWTRSGNVWTAPIATPVLDFRDWSYVYGSRKWTRVNGRPQLPQEWSWSSNVLRIRSVVHPSSLQYAAATTHYRVSQAKDIGWTESGAKTTFSSSGLKVDGGSGAPNGTATVFRSLPGDSGYSIFPRRFWAWDASNDSNVTSDGNTWTYANTIWNLSALGANQWEQDAGDPNVWKLRLDRDTSNNPRTDNGGYVLGRANALLINGIKYTRVGSNTSPQISSVNAPYTFQSWGPIVPSGAQNAWIAVYSPAGNPATVFDQIVVSGRNREGYTTSNFHIILDSARGDFVDFPMTYDDQALDFIYNIHYTGLNGLRRQDHGQPEGQTGGDDGFNSIVIHERCTVEQLWGDRIQLMKWSSVTRSGEKAYFGPTYLRGPRHNIIRDVKIRRLDIAEGAKENTFENLQFTAAPGATFMGITQAGNHVSTIDMTGVRAAVGSKIVVTGDVSKVNLTINGQAIVFDGQEYVWTNEDSLAVPPPAREQSSDFNWDGVDDVVFYHQNTGRVVVQLVGNDTVPTGEVMFLRRLPSLDWQIAGVADFDMDGSADLLLRDRVTGANRIWFFTNSVFKSVLNLPRLGPAFRVAGVADFSGDGRPDVLWQHNNKQHVVWSVSNGVTPVAATFPANPAVTTVGAGDFTGDGQNDVLVRNANTGQNYIWQMNGANFVRGQRIQSVAAAWRVADVHDFDQDGIADILWRSLAGRQALWLMNANGAIKENKPMPGFPSPLWQPPLGGLPPDEAPSAFAPVDVISEAPAILPKAASPKVTYALTTRGVG